MKPSSRSRLLAVLSRSATWSRLPSRSGEGVRDLEDLLPGDQEYLRGDRDLRYDLLLLLLRGLPVRDLVLARPLESGDPDLDLVLGLRDLLRLRALEPDPGTSPSDTPGEDITSQSVFSFLENYHRIYSCRLCNWGYTVWLCLRKSTWTSTSWTTCRCTCSGG